MARRYRAEVVVADEIGVYHCVQRVVRRAFLCGVDPLSGNSYDHRRGADKVQIRCQEPIEEKFTSTMAFGS